MAYYGTYGTQGLGAALQNFRHRMSKAFSFSQPYEPSAAMIDAENRRRWAQAASTPDPPERYSSQVAPAAHRAARQSTPPASAIGGGGQSDEEYIRKRRTGARILDFFK